MSELVATLVCNQQYLVFTELYLFCIPYSVFIT